MKVCPTTGCPTLIPKSARYCPEHSKDYERRRGTPTARGYGQAHRLERARWQARITRGDTVTCATCPTTITADMRWDLGHDHTNGGHLGPQCIPCNRGDGGRRGAQTRNAQQ